MTIRPKQQHDTKILSHQNCYR